MFGDGGLSFREFVMNEPLPLSAIHDATLEFLRDRDDAILFGAQAVNAYVDESRMTQDVDIQSPRAAALSLEIRHFLAEKFRIAIRERATVEGLGYRLDQLQKPKNRHLIDIRQVDPPPPAQRVQGVLVVTPPELIAEKIQAWTHRRGKPKAFTDQRDLAVLLLTFPKLKTLHGPVRDRLLAHGASEAALSVWSEWVVQEIHPEDEDSGY